MTAITVANKEWDIIDDVKDALANATIAGSAAFVAVTVSTSEDQAEECQFKAHPAAIVQYLGTDQSETPEGHLACTLHVELIIAAKAAAGGTDESARLQEILRLIGAAKNAIGAGKPADSSSWGDDEDAVRQLAFETPKIEMAAASPWVVARLPLTVGYILESDTSH